ncbi:hypothetical protein GCM10007063_13960 [Lentibacillus kapialis]|uniref:Uncharacterized protein n=1 Tax=Lentibacillus kapialis TaxID=340214 RepID=A0A917PUR7_9BACI|nr:hypothetical protein GCM10007063_13960 [Lentibacillus kapialis]
MIRIYLPRTDRFDPTESIMSNNVSLLQIGSKRYQVKNNVEFTVLVWYIYDCAQVARINDVPLSRSEIRALVWKE